VPNPVEIIGSARARIARLAAIRAAVGAIGPAITATALGLLIEPIGDITWTRWGYTMPAERADALGTGLLCVGALTVLVGVALAYRAYRRANDFAAAAETLDRRLDCHDQIVTLASLANPAAAEKVRALRTPLFPVLWRHAIAYFEGFDAKKEFRLEVGEPIRRSSMFAGAIGLAMILATLGLVRAPSRESAEAARLRTIAKEIARSATSPDDAALADSVRKAADALENPKLPPEEKKKKIQEAMQQAKAAEQKRNNSQSGKDQGTGKSNSQSGAGNSKGQGKTKSEASGNGSGKAEGGSGADSGKSGSESGKNNNANGKGSGNAGGGKKSAQNDKSDQSKDKGENSSVDLQNELAKAEAQVETSDAKNAGATQQPGDDKNKGGANKPGDDRNQKGGDQFNPDMPGNIAKPASNGDRNLPAAGGKSKDNKDQGSNLGDTHLGENPAPANYQRYLKPGEKGAPLDLKDSRYVMFRLPGATPSGSGGKTVLDTERPKATTAYVNAPLAPTSDDAPPDERQLVPPRYRDMIR
jgi:hypothetical protein